VHTPGVINVINYLKHRRRTDTTNELIPISLACRVQDSNATFFQGLWMAQELKKTLVMADVKRQQALIDDL